MHHEDTIKFLRSLNRKACVFIFTRDDADGFIPEGKTMTDDGWERTVHSMQAALPDDCWWEYFGSFVTDNCEDKINGS